MKAPKDYIVFPLDVPHFDEAKTYIDMLANDVGMFKVGMEIFYRTGKDIIRYIQDVADVKIFLDLKLYDIPATVERAVRVVSELGVDYITVHCSESLKVLEAAVEGSDGKVGILGVTVLTSISSEDIRDVGYKEKYADNLQELVMKRAEMAYRTRCSGIVCSGLEVKSIKKTFGKDFITMVPGIRPEWKGVGKNDQQRVVTPSEAVRNGADFLVIGRPIRDAKNPKDAAISIAGEIEKAL